MNRFIYFKMNFCPCLIHGKNSIESKSVLSECTSIFICLSIRKPHIKRRGWDSNPRALADKRFSRPPRYDHFDTSPCSIFKHLNRCPRKHCLNSIALSDEIRQVFFSLFLPAAFRPAKFIAVRFSDSEPH